MGGSKRKTLNEKELGSLYLLSETPIIIDRIIRAKKWTDKDIADLHHGLSHHAPDMALIAIALSGNLLSETMKEANLGNIDLSALSTELKYLSVNTLEEVGRIWIDVYRYGLVNEQDIHDLIHESPDILCIFISLFMDISDMIEEKESYIRAISACLMYQSEAHADQARTLIENAAHKNTPPRQTESLRDHIPLPLELQNQKFTDNIVAFSLFGEQSQKPV